jgi:hypothetical protein
MTPAEAQEARRVAETRAAQEAAVRQEAEARAAQAEAELERLDLNDARHDDGFIRVSRALWLQGGWHPPPSDPALPDAIKWRP